MSDYDYDDDYEYDPWNHMVNDPVDFQMNGYGGFGYDTSHVKSDGNHSALARAAKDGNLGAVQSLVRGCSSSSSSSSSSAARKDDSSQQSFHLQKNVFYISSLTNHVTRTI